MTIVSDFLSTGSAQVPISNHVLDRYKLSYDPASTSTVNYELLPDASELRDMELAYRVDTVTGEKANAKCDQAILSAILAVFTFFILAIVLARYRSVGFAAGIGATFSGLLMLSHFVQIFRGMASISFLGLFTRLVVPTVSSVTVFAIGTALEASSWVRLGAALTLGAFWVVGLNFYGSKPIECYQEYLLTAPFLTPEERKNQTPARHRESLVISGVSACAVVTAIVVGVPYLVHWLGLALSIGLTTAAVAVCLYAFLVIHWSVVRDLFVTARKIVAVNLDYGAQSLPALGIWMPRGIYKRRLAVMGILIPATASLVLAFNYFSPEEFVRKCEESRDVHLHTADLDREIEDIRANRDPIFLQYQVDREGRESHAADLERKRDEQVNQIREQYARDYAASSVRWVFYPAREATASGKVWWLGIYLAPILGPVLIVPATLLSVYYRPIIQCMETERWLADRGKRRDTPRMGVVCRPAVRF